MPKTASIKLVRCTSPGCKRFARHWVACSKVRNQRRRPICHRCYKQNETSIHLLNQAAA